MATCIAASARGAPGSARYAWASGSIDSRTIRSSQDRVLLGAANPKSGIGSLGCGQRMRVSDYDYGRDLRGINLALRLLRHEARLSTVCAWTGFNEERVRVLSRSRRRHQVNRVAGTHRGPSPRRVKPLFAS